MRSIARMAAAAQNALSGRLGGFKTNLNAAFKLRTRLPKRQEINGLGGFEATFKLERGPQNRDCEPKRISTPRRNSCPTKKRRGKTVT